VYESILAILIDELFYDLEHGAEIEAGMLVAINMHIPNALHIVCSRSGGRLMEVSREAPNGIGSLGRAPKSLLEGKVRRSAKLPASLATTL